MVRGHLHRAKPGHQQGDQTEGAGLGEIGHADRQPELEQRADIGPVRGLVARKRQGGPVGGRAPYPPHNCRQVKPDTQQRGPGTAHATQARKTQLAEYQQPVDADIEQQGQQGNHHQRLGLVHARAVAVEHPVGTKRRQCKTDHRHKVPRQHPHPGFDVQLPEHQRGGIRHQHRHQPDEQRLPQSLAHHAWNARELLRAQVLRNHRVDRHQHPHERDDHDMPDRHPQRHARQVLRRGMPSHGYIGHAHTHGGQLVDQDRPGQLP